MLILDNRYNQGSPNKSTFLKSNLEENKPD